MQENACSGIRLRMFSVKLLSVTTGVISVLVPPQKTGSSMRWLLLTGKRGTVDVKALWSDPPISRPVASTDYPALEKVADMAIREKQKFERLVVPKETLLEMFAVRTNLPCRSRRDLIPLPAISITSTRSISSSPKSPMARPRPCTAAGPWSTCAWAHISRTRARSRRS